MKYIFFIRIRQSIYIDLKVFILKKKEIALLIYTRNPKMVILNKKNIVSTFYFYNKPRNSCFKKQNQTTFLKKF